MTLGAGLACTELGSPLRSPTKIDLKTDSKFSIPESKKWDRAKMPWLCHWHDTSNVRYDRAEWTHNYNPRTRDDEATPFLIDDIWSKAIVEPEIHWKPLSNWLLDSVLFSRLATWMSQTLPQEFMKRKRKGGPHSPNTQVWADTAAWAIWWIPGQSDTYRQKLH